jgi:FkbM family methyltransferase
LFEPVEEFYPAIRQNYADVDYELVEVAASDQDGSADLTVRAISGKPDFAQAASWAINPSGTNRAVRTVRLDTFFRDEMYGDLLLKIDVDGAELKVLAGATGILSRVSCIVIEASPERAFYQRSKFLFEAGFELFDIVDLCYYHGTFHQCDLIFLRTEHFKSPRVNGWLNSGFVSNQWVSLDEGRIGLEVGGKQSLRDAAEYCTQRSESGGL